MENKIGEVVKIGEKILAYNYNMNNEENAYRNIDDITDDNTVIIYAGDLVYIEGFTNKLHIAISKGEENWTIVTTDNSDYSEIATNEVHNKWNAKRYTSVSYDECPVKSIFNSDDLLKYGGKDFVINAFKYNALKNNSTDNIYHNTEEIEEKFIKQIYDLVDHEVPITEEIAKHIANRVIEGWIETEFDPIGTCAELHTPGTDPIVYVGDLFFIENEYRILVGNSSKINYYFTTKDENQIHLDKHMFPESQHCIKICEKEYCVYDEIDKYNKINEYNNEIDKYDKIDEYDNNIVYLPIQYNKQWIITHRHYMPIIKNYINKIDNKWEEELHYLIPYIKLDNELALHIAYQILSGLDTETCEIGYTIEGKMVIVNSSFGISYNDNKINTIELDNLCTDLYGTYLYPLLKNNLKNGDIVYIEGVYAFYYNGKYITIDIYNNLKEITDDSKQITINKALNFMDILNNKINIDYIIKNEDKNNENIKNMIKLNIQNKL